MSISKEQRARILALFYAEHWKVGTIARELGVHADTVKAAVGTKSFVSRGPRARPSLLRPYRDFITHTLKQHPRLRATRLYDMLEPRGYRGSRRQLRRFIATIRPRPAPEAFLRLNPMPGEQAQMDWGKFGEMEMVGGVRKLSCFVMVLPWSRAAYARFTLDERMDTFLRGHVEAFEAFGGAPRQMVYDNLKSAVLERVGEHARFHPELLELGSHYHFMPRLCAPRRGNEKGNVERFIRYLRESFFAARVFDDLGDLNDQLARWLSERAFLRVHPTDPERRSVAAHHELERPRLLPLPAHRPNTECVETLRSGKQPYLRFDCNDYSIPHTLVRKPLTLRADGKRVRVFDGSELVAEHAREYGKRQVIEDAAHVDALVAQKRRATELRGRDRLRAMCEHADALLDDLARRGEPLRQRTATLNRLLGRYGAEALDAAIVEAFDKGVPAVGSIAYLLDRASRRAGQPVPLAVPLPAQLREKDVVVIPHDMSEYDKLGFGSDEDERDEEVTS
jgi:transposase